MNEKQIKWQELVKLFAYEVAHPNNWFMPPIINELEHKINCELTFDIDEFSHDGINAIIEYSITLYSEEIGDLDIDLTRIYIMLDDWESVFFLMNMFKVDGNKVQKEPTFQTKNKNIAVEVLNGDYEVKEFNLNYQYDDSLIIELKTYKNEIDNYYENRYRTSGFLKAV